MASSSFSVAAADESSPPLDSPYYYYEEGGVEGGDGPLNDEAESRFVDVLPPLESDLADMEPLFDLSDMLRDIDESRDHQPPPPPPPPQLRRTPRKRKSSSCRLYSPPPPPPPLRRETHVERAKLAGLDLDKHRRAATTTSDRRRWTFEEDDVLRKCFSSEGRRERLVHWKEIAALLPNRTPMQCLMRWRVTRPGIRRGRWSVEEDVRLRKLVETYGAHRWRVVGAMMETRTNKQCRERWLNALAPGICTEKWTPQQLKQLVEEVEKRGRAWASLEKLFPGRTANDIKNKWYLICGRRDTTEKNERLREKRRRVEEEGEVLL